MPIQNFPGWSELVLWYLSFIAAIVAHEAAHAWAAFKLGDPTAYQGGQVTLDPIPHIRREPMGTVVVPLLSFVAGGWMIGWASTPYDRAWADRQPRYAALMALAGPMANLALLLGSGVLIRLGMVLGYFHAPGKIGFTSVVASYQPGVPHGLAVLLSIFFSLNLILLVFNLLPLPPMDGSAIVALAMSDATARRYRQFIERSGFAFLGLILAWKFFGEIIRPLRLLAIQLLYPGAHYN